MATGAINMLSFLLPLLSLSLSFLLLLLLLLLWLLFLLLFMFCGSKLESLLQMLLLVPVANWGEPPVGQASPDV